eukprot:scaffold12033_cov125-Isochrysis_galbana.AAC.2
MPNAHSEHPSATSDRPTCARRTCTLVRKRPSSSLAAAGGNASTRCEEVPPPGGCIGRICSTLTGPLIEPVSSRSSAQMRCTAWPMCRSRVGRRTTCSHANGARSSGSTSWMTRGCCSAEHGLWLMRSGAEVMLSTRYGASSLGCSVKTTCIVGPSD